MEGRVSLAGERRKRLREFIARFRVQDVDKARRQELLEIRGGLE